MGDRSEITPALCRQMLRYDPETGELFWKTRTPDMFTVGDPGVRRARTPEHKCANWNAKHAGQQAFNTPTTGGYRYGIINRVSCKAHRIAWAIHHGEWPQGDLDHINGDTSDNRIANLRDVSHAVNMRNSKIRVDNSSGYAGVCWFQQTSRWQVRVGDRHVGFFGSIEQAVSARDAARAHLGYTGRGEQ